MTDPKHTLPQVVGRLEAVERAVAAQNSQYTELKVDMARIDTEIKGIREQARAHSEMQTKATTDLKHQLDETHKSTQTLVSDSARELQESVDKIVSALGIDEDPHAAYTLRYDLKFLKGLRKGREDALSVVWRTLIGLTLTATAVLLVLGIASYFNVNPMR